MVGEDSSGIGLVSPFFIFLALGLVAFKSFIKLTTGTCRSTRRMDGKTVIITGANTGIGKETALDLARRGARVIMACRSLDRAYVAREEIVSKTSNSNVVVRQLDLLSLKSVRAFASEIVNTERRLDVLINNAGIVGAERKMTEDGLEHTMQSNYFGHFLLTNLLLGLLNRTGNARVITVSSISHEWMKIFDFNNLNAERDDNALHIYWMSKLCNVLFSNELARRTAGTGITSNSLHPGAIVTDIFRNLPTLHKGSIRATLRLFFKDAREGAQTTIHLAVSEEVEGVTQKYFADCKEKKPSALALDEGNAKKLWEMSEKLVGLEPSEIEG